MFSLIVLAVLAGLFVMEDHDFTGETASQGNQSMHSTEEQDAPDAQSVGNEAAHDFVREDALQDNQEIHPDEQQDPPDVQVVNNIAGSEENAVTPGDVLKVC